MCNIVTSTKQSRPPWTTWVLQHHDRHPHHGVSKAVARSPHYDHGRTSGLEGTCFSKGISNGFKFSGRLPAGAAAPQRAARELQRLRGEAFEVKILKWSGVEVKVLSEFEVNLKWKERWQSGEKERKRSGKWGKELSARQVLWSPATESRSGDLTSKASREKDEKKALGGEMPKKSIINKSILKIFWDFLRFIEIYWDLLRFMS